VTEAVSETAWLVVAVAAGAVAAFAWILRERWIYRRRAARRRGS
jgi:hypothetical protein